MKELKKKWMNYANGNVFKNKNGNRDSMKNLLNSISRWRGFAIHVLQNIADSTQVATDSVDSANLARVAGIICKSTPFLSQTEIYLRQKEICLNQTEIFLRQKETVSIFLLYFCAPDSHYAPCMFKVLRIQAGIRY